MSALHLSYKFGLNNLLNKVFDIDKKKIGLLRLVIKDSLSLCL
jgi:hypothetical protein